MANTRPTRTHPGSTPDFELVRSEDLALPVAAEEKTRTDEVGTAALSVAVEEDLGAVELPDDDYTGDWRSDYGDSVGISSWREL